MICGCVEIGMSIRESQMAKKLALVLATLTVALSAAAAQLASTDEPSVVTFSNVAK